MKFRNACLGLLVALSLTAVTGAQEYPTAQGNGQRTGHTADPLNFNPDRAFLRWFDPIGAVANVIDNWEAGAGMNPVNSYGFPDQIWASMYLDVDPLALPTHPPYLFTAPVPSASPDQYWIPQAPNTASVFTWNFGGLTPGQEYSLFVNLPIGPSDVDNTNAINLFYQTQFQVYEIDGVDNPDNPGQPIYQKVDTFLSGGGWVRLGNDGADTSRVFTVSTGSTSIQIRLINTIPRDNQGNLADERTNIVVYADAAKIERSQNNIGSYIAQPVVGHLTTNPGLYPWRVYGARMEELNSVDNGIVRNYPNYGVLSSYAHAGQVINTGDNTWRRNIAWSWPAKRPFDGTVAQGDRYNAERVDFLEGTGKYPAATDRFQERLLYDNTNANITVSAGWAQSTANLGFLGTDYLVKPGVAAAGATVTYHPQLTPGTWSADVWIPGSGNKADDVVYEIRINGVAAGQAVVDQSTSSGWVTLVAGFVRSWTIDSTQDLSIVVTDGSSTPGRDVVADMVRFRRTADMAIKSTPIYAGDVDINVGGTTNPRDVIIVASENGHIYCLNAEGTLDGTGKPTGDTTVYWAYPSETAVDPNKVLGLDGPDGMAEMPVGFGITSGAVENVEVTPGVFRNLLYIGSTNGRIYCFDIEGRGDGTIERRWTYPDDYPQPSVESRLGPIVGSVAYEVTAAGPTLFVPTQQGRLYALDAVGDNNTKTTTERWTYPALASNPIGTILNTPLVAFGNVYFGTGASAFAGGSTFYAININDTNADLEGDVVWSRDTINGVGFQPFNTATAASAPLLDHGGAFGPLNTIFIANDNFHLYGLNAASGDPIWDEDAGVSAVASLSYTYLRVSDAVGGVNTVSQPMLMVPTGGQYQGYHADAASLNRFGERLAWTASSGGSNVLTPLAHGAKDPTMAAPFDDENAWMYGANGSGDLAAWNYDPDFPDNSQQLSIGPPPFDTEGAVDDNLGDRMNDAISRARVWLVLPADYEALVQKVRNGSVTYAELTAAMNKVTRLNFEFGETLYMIITDLPDPAAYSPVLDYTIDIKLTGKDGRTQSRAYTVSAVNGSPDAFTSRTLVTAWPLQPFNGSSIAPGAVRLTVSLLATERPGANRVIPDTQMFPQDITLQGGRFNLNNPLAVAMYANPATQSIGVSTDPNSPEVPLNGNLVLNGVNPTLKSIGKLFGNTTAEDNTGSQIGHGATAVTTVRVYDRSLLRLIRGPQIGVTNVRMDLGDMWVPNGYVPFKGLDPVQFPNMEDRPGSPGNNNSLDYPDIRRDRLEVTKSRSGAVENPIFSGVSLLPPTFTSAQENAYRSTAANYNAGLDRVLVSTPFDFKLNVPHFQPPANAYDGLQNVFVDTASSGVFSNGDGATKAYRVFNLFGEVAVDERLEVGTPTVDLGSIPSGGGFSPVAPWANANFSLLDPMFTSTAFPYYQRFSTFNTGNVNMLNLRLAKSVSPNVSSAAAAVLFGGSAIAPLALLDARWHMHSDLDPIFVPNALNNRVILQKARPGDGEGTRLRVNPRRRANPNLAVQSDGDFLDVADFNGDAVAYDQSKLDPKVAVSVPIGAPVGTYQHEIFPFEDRQTTTADATFPRLEGDITNPTVYEPYADNGFILRFKVRESRMTTRSTFKSAPMVDDFGFTGQEPFLWNNGKPAAARDGSGTLITAFASDRVTAANLPGFLARPRLAADTGTVTSNYIYVSTIPLNQPNFLPTGPASPISDLSRFRPASNTRWFTHGTAGFPAAAPDVVWGLPPAQLDSGANYSNPAFPADGMFEPLTNSAAGKTDRQWMYMAFTGEVNRKTGTNQRVKDSRLFLTRVEVDQQGQAALDNNLITMNQDGTPVALENAIGRPSIIQVDDNAAVFYSLGSGSNSQLGFSFYDGTNWRKFGGGGGRSSAIESLRIGKTFEAVEAPAVTIRDVQGGRSRIDMSFTARIKGRAQEEVYFARVNANDAGLPQQTLGTYLVPFGTRVDPLVKDEKTGTYWTAGSEWRLGFTDLNGSDEGAINNMTLQTFIDIKRLSIESGNAVYRTVLDHNSRTQVEGSQTISYNCLLGGKVYIDTASGSIQFSNAVIGQSMKLYVRYTPRVLRVTESNGLNARGVSMAFDEHYIGDASYWLTTSSTGASLAVPARNDRFMITYSKTSASNQDRTRAYYTTIRFGVKLPTAIYTNQDGTIPTLMVGGTTTPYQADPAIGKLYFGKEMEDQTITVQYRGRDESGRDLGVLNVTLVVGVILETRETPVPMDEGISNESAMGLALDPLGAGWDGVNVNLRRPGLFWMFWTSTRGGGSDIYFQTLAPKFGSVVSGQP